MTLAGVAVLAGCGSVFGGGILDTTGKVAFDTPMPVPPLADSHADASGRTVFELTARRGTTEFLPGAQTTTWGYNGSYLGPTIVAQRGEKVTVDVTNELSETTTVHWHGMHLPAAMDGGPHQPIEPGRTWSPQWTIDQPAATLWYHPHPHGETLKHVTMGLAGMVILKDEAEEALPLPRDYGVDDFPVIVQDRRFTDAGQFDTGTRGFIGPVGDTILVNGAIGAYLDVTTDVVRLRLLNGSDARSYDFGFGDRRSFDLIATDGGLLPAPVRLTDIRLSPGERAEVLVRMTPGEQLTLRSFPVDLGIPDVTAAMNAGRDTLDVLQLRAAPTLEQRGTVPESLVPIERWDAARASVTRTFTLEGFEINGKHMEMGRIDETVVVDTLERWVVTNTQGMPHSFHVHDTQFQIASIDGAPPPPELAGWKDTIYAAPHTEYVLLMRFTDYTDPDTPYMYHCHLLWHEDQGMMGQFVVVNPGERAGTPTSPASQPHAGTRAGAGPRTTEMTHDH